MRQLLAGNYAVAEAVRLSRVQLVAAYPITPQTPIYEKLSDMENEGKLSGIMMRTESEHSAMAACIAASLTGVRTFTATASQGLALMHEMLHFASGNRVPIVMCNVNRVVSAPWAFGSDQSDSLSQRDTGWLQFYCEDAQEALDTVIQAYKIAGNSALSRHRRYGRLFHFPFHRAHRDPGPGRRRRLSSAVQHSHPLQHRRPGLRHERGKSRAVYGLPPEKL